MAGIEDLYARGLISDDALDRAAQRMMTHQAEQPNTAQPYLDFARNFASGGLQRALGLPNNVIGRALQNPDNVAAMGVMTPIKGTGVQMGSPEIGDLNPAANMNPSAGEVERINAQKDRLYDLLMKAVRSNKNKGVISPFEKRIGSQINDLNNQLPPRPPGE